MPSVTPIRDQIVLVTRRVIPFVCSNALRLEIGPGPDAAGQVWLRSVWCFVFSWSQGPAWLQRAALVFWLVALLGPLSQSLHWTRPATGGPRGIVGSLPTLAISDKQALAYFPVGRSNRLRLTFANRTDAPFLVELRTAAQHLSFEVPPGLISQDLRSQGGPLAVEFRVVPAPVVDHRAGRLDLLVGARATAELVWFLRLTAIACVAAFLALLGSAIQGREFRTYRLSFFLLVFGIGVWVWSRSKGIIVGDELEYLLVAESLTRDLDLDLANQWLPEYASLLPRFMPENYTSVASLSGMGPIHSPLLGFLLTPAQLGSLLPLQSNPVVLAKMGLLLLSAGNLTLMMSIALHRIGRSPEALLLVPLAFGLPMLAYADQIYPEPVVALLLLVAYWCFANARAHWFMLAAAVVVALLHPKFVGCALVLVIARGFAGKEQPGTRISGKWRLIAVIAMVLLVVGLPLLVSRILFGSLTGPYTGADLQLASLPLKYLGYIFDADRGLLGPNPLMLLAIVGVVATLVSRGRGALLLAALILAAHLPNLLHPGWLGTCPHGRQWVAAYPLLFVAGGETLRRFVQARQGGRIPRMELALLGGLLFVFSLLTLAQAWFYALEPGNYYSHLARPYVFLQALGGRVAFLKGSLFLRHPFDGQGTALMVWFGILVAALLYGIRLGRLLRTQCSSAPARGKSITATRS